jgi:hypothetical protein
VISVQGVVNPPSYALALASIAFSLSGRGRGPHPPDLHQARSGAFRPTCCLLTLLLLSCQPWCCQCNWTLQGFCRLLQSFPARFQPCKARQVLTATSQASLSGPTWCPALWCLGRTMALSSFTRCRTHQGAALVALMGSSQPLKTTYLQQLQHVRLMQHARCSPAMATISRLTVAQLYHPGRSAVSLNSCSGSRCSTAPGLAVGRGWQTA